MLQVKQVKETSVDRCHLRLVTGIKGLQAKTAMSENRGSFTIDAALGGDGYLYHPHILFAQDGMTSDMLPQTTKNWKWMPLSNRLALLSFQGKLHHNPYPNEHAHTTRHMP